MDLEQQFWWNWWVNLALAIATFLAVLAALFGEWFRSKLFPPQLQLHLLGAEGELGRIRHPAVIDEGLLVEDERLEATRYYHVRVSNLMRLSPAKDVQVFLTRVEEPGPNRNLQTTWAGEVPVSWRNQQISPLTRIIGHDFDCDLCSVGEGRWLRLHPLVAPFTLNVERRDACTLVVWLQARSTQMDSAVCRIQLAWDGQWEEGEHEMKRHLVVEELPQPLS